MEKQGKVSKVAICPKCDGFILACHKDYLDKETEKEFTDLSNDGFCVKIETVEETRARDYRDYEECVRGECKPTKKH